MKFFLFSIFFLISLLHSRAQEFNLGFEKNSFSKYSFPDGWFQWGTGYSLEPDTVQRHSGKYSLSIKPTKEKNQDSFGCIAYSIPAKYEGDSITLKAYLKYTDVKEGYVGLLLRIDSHEGILNFDNMEKENVQGSSDWKQFSVTLAYPMEAKTIYIGAILSGSGNLWVDDFNISINGNNPTVLKSTEQIHYKAYDDTEFDENSKIQEIEPSEKLVDDLFILGKVWGFLKYYHPEIRKGNYNWDYELFRFLPKFIKCKNVAERNSFLYDWISSFGNIKTNIKPIDTSRNIYIEPNLSWINGKEFGEKLNSLLTNIKNTKRQGTSFYLKTVSGIGNPIFDNENAYSSMKYPDFGYRLLSLYRYWNIIEYYFPYKNLIGERWDSTLEVFIPKFVNSKNELEYKLTTLSLIASIHDTHANIWGYDNTLLKYKGNNFAPLKVKFIEGKVVVYDYHNDSLGKETGLCKGDIITKINNESIEEVVKRKIPLTPASNYETQLREIALTLLRTNDSLLAIEYIHEGRIEIKKIYCTRGNLLISLNKYQKRDTCYKLLNNNISYLYPESLDPGYLNKLFPRIQSTKGLIIDLRCYPSEFIVYSLGEFLLTESKPFVKFTNASINTPGQFLFTNVFTVGRNNPNYYKGKVVILVNELTQSQAEYTAMALKVVPAAKVIGSTTAGADGNISEISLPGGIKTAISGIGVFYPNGKGTQRVGIIPDIEIKQTINGIKNGVDEILNRAIIEIDK